MINNKSAETFAWIIVGVFILTIILLWLGNLMYYSYDMISQFNNANRISILQNNLINIVKKIDTTGIWENEFFYVYKNETTNNFEAFTGILNSEYKYIDIHGNKVDDIVAYDKPIYSRVLWKERSDTSLQNNSEVIRVYIKKLIKK